MPYKNTFLFQPESGTGGGDGGSGGGDGGGSTGGGSTEAPAASQVSQADHDKLKQELSDARKEAAKYRTERKDLAERLEKLEEGQKSEAQKLQEKNDKTVEENTRLLETNRDLRVRTLAGSVGIADAKAAADAASLLDWDKVKDQDSDSAIEEALRELVKDRPYLLGNVAGGGDGGEGGGQGGKNFDMNREIRKAAGYAS